MASLMAEMRSMRCEMRDERERATRAEARHGRDLDQARRAADAAMSVAEGVAASQQLQMAATERAERRSMETDARMMIATASRGGGGVGGRGGGRGERREGGGDRVVEGGGGRSGVVSTIVVLGSSETAGKSEVGSTTVDKQAEAEAMPAGNLEEKQEMMRQRRAERHAAAAAAAAAANTSPSSHTPGSPATPAIGPPPFTAVTARPETLPNEDAAFPAAASKRRRDATAATTEHLARAAPAQRIDASRLATAGDVKPEVSAAVAASHATGNRGSDSGNAMTGSAAEEEAAAALTMTNNNEEGIHVVAAAAAAAAPAIASDDWLAGTELASVDEWETAAAAAAAADAAVHEAVYDRVAQKSHEARAAAAAGGDDIAAAFAAAETLVVSALRSTLVDGKLDPSEYDAIVRAVAAAELRVTRTLDSVEVAALGEVAKPLTLNPKP